ncbi:MobA/MobL family protein [Variovorax sp. CF313]|uniref:MobA/MobL family protein n=1 Tax=Variovorax sp. CF313 TaxID=1144315 RepID=UPI0012F8C437|nr:MobA/MobL family protein [Variovorax sp. CF313]
MHSQYISRQRTNGAQDLIAKGHLNMPSFANNDPHTFWEAADKHERANGSAAREYVVSLPKELPDEKNTALAWRLVHLLANTRPCEFALHKPLGSISGEEHPHVHIQTSDRPLDGIDRTPEQHFRRANSKAPALGGARKLSGGKTPLQMKIELQETREKVAEEINRMLSEEGLPQRVDHRSNKEKGTQKTAERRLHPATVRQLSEHERELIRQARRLGRG